MAPSTTSTGVIAQLSLGQPRRSHSNSPVSSPLPQPFEDLTGSVSSFQPEHESTQQFDTATQDQLLNIASSARRFGRFGVDGHQSDAGRNGVADIAGRSPSPDHSLSIELGRGVKRSMRNSPNRILDDEMSENPIISLGDDSLYDLIGTPPTQSRATGRKSDGADRLGLRKEASVRRATTATQADLTKTSDIVPTKARSTSANNRRSLSDMHARVQAFSDSSFIEEPQAAMHGTKDRNTRFSKSRQASGLDQGIPTRFTAGSGLGATYNQTPRRQMAAAAPDAANFTGNQTGQSFMLPDLPNITELVSGVRKDGTPVFSRTTKSRSRFTSASYNKGADVDTISHARLHSIPLPEEEKAIFASLQLLKEKVAQLESEKSEATKRIEEYENEVIDLRSQVHVQQRFRRPDSGLGSDEDRDARDKWRVEKSNMQASLKAVQDRLERSERKVSVSEIAVKRMTQERDNLVTQLGVAFYTSEELKDENEQLLSDKENLEQANNRMRSELESFEKENDDLRVQIVRIQARGEDERRQWNDREAELKSRIHRREQSVREMKDITREMWSGQKDDTKKEKRRSSGRLGETTQGNIMDRVEQEIRKARAEAKGKNGAGMAQSKDTSSGSRSRSKSQQRRASSRSSRRVSSTQTAAQSESESDAESTTQLEMPKSTRQSLNRTQSPNVAAQQEQDDDKDITYLSFLDPNEIANLRKKLEDERRATKQARSASGIKTHDFPRKSSLKGFTNGITDGLTTGHFFVKDTAGESTTEVLTRNVRIQSPHTSDAISYEEPNATTDVSMLSTASRRPRSTSFEEMTSAFIIPDITLHKRASSLAVEHNKEKCTACPSKGQEHQIPAPIPVSERDADMTSATIRPSQAPPAALATVLKQLQDEVTHLKLKLAAYQQAYGSHDPALGQRKRKSIKAKIDMLLAEVERRSEQIYALYDVLEGQKQNQVKGEDVEETMQSLGIDADELAQKAAKASKKSKTKTGINRLDELLAESDDEMSWEGLSDKSDVENVGVGAPRRRSVVA